MGLLVIIYVLIGGGFSLEYIKDEPRNRVTFLIFLLFFAIWGFLVIGWIGTLLAKKMKG